MATIPVPPSYSEILANAIDSTVSKLGLPALRKGNPVLSILEAASRSDARQAQDIFNLLSSVSLDRATGQALDRIGADEDATRIPETPASGPVTIGDSSFQKVSSRIFQGKAAPNVGSVTVYVQDGASFTPTGAIYLGRGTQNLEGPLNYTSLTNNGSYWTITLSLSNPTQKYHNIGESVILAQGGNRNIPTGTTVQTSQGNNSTSTQYTTVFNTVIPDGEVQVANVQVVCAVSGVAGNTIAGGINGFASPPFAGATVTNPLPYSNGLATEDDETYRERLRQVRQSRSRGTPLAIKVNLTGITALDENRRILSTSVLTRQGYPTTVYVDDGTGYEAKDTGIPYEVLVDQALGGEQYMQLANGRPTAKAYAKAGLTAPFSLNEGDTLSVKVGGVLYQHTFSASSFRNIGNASGYEVVSAINANATLAFQARTTDNGETVCVFAKSDTNEDIEVVGAPTGFSDANLVLGFALGRNDTLRLYKNDRLLNKDGTLAIISSVPQGSWGNVTSGDTLIMSVDGITLPTITFVDQDFVNANTNYSTAAASNDLASWAKVFNSKIPGVTATVSGGTLQLTSNLGRNARASVSIDGASSMVSKNMFVAQTVTGKDLDYTFDRNLGQIRVEDTLVGAVGDSFTAGSISTRAFLQTPAFNTLSFAATPTTITGQTGAEIFFCVDSDAKIVPVGVNNTTLIFSRILIGTWGYQVTATTSIPGLFDNVEPGDFAIFTDPGLPDADRGVWRITERTSTYIRWERTSLYAGTGTYTLSFGGLTFVRSSTAPQRVYFPYAAATPYTATSIAAIINAQLSGATARVYRTTSVRVRTNRFAIGGDIMFVAANADGYRIGFEQGLLVENETSHLASQEATEDEGGTPEFLCANTFDFGNVTPNELTIAITGQISPEHILKAVRPLSPDTDERQGSRGHQTAVEHLNSGTDILVRKAPFNQEWLNKQRILMSRPFDISSNDELAILIDNDTASKRFVAPMYRNVTPAVTTYGNSNVLKDADNSNASLAKVFGTSFDWSDFAVHMHARGKSHRISNADTNQTILWRYYRMGPEGEQAYVKYDYPVAPSQPVKAVLQNTDQKNTSVSIQIASGPARTGYTFRSSSYIGVVIPNPGTPTNGLYQKWYILNLKINTAERTVQLYYTPNLMAGIISIGDIVQGQTSGATGTVRAISGNYLTLAQGNNISFVAEQLKNVTTTILHVGDLLYGQYDPRTTLTLTKPAGVIQMGFNIGDLIWVQSSDINFLSGQRVITAFNDSTSQITYSDVTISMANASGSIGTVSRDPNGEAKWGGGSSNVAAGDIFHTDSPQYAAYASGNYFNGGLQWNQPMRIATFDSSWLGGKTPVYAPLTNYFGITWVPLNDPTAVSIYPLNAGANTITGIATAVNAQAGSPVSAVAIGTGLNTSGVISKATYEPAPDGLANTSPVGWDGVSLGYQLYDGINWIRSNTTPVNPSTDFTFVFKKDVETSLVSNNDWLNEKIRLIPITAKGLNNYLNTSGPGGLFANAEIMQAISGRRPQIATLTVGSRGSVEIQGGTANAATAIIQGAAVQLGAPIIGLQVPLKSGVSISASDSLGFNAKNWVKVQNTLAVEKTRITSATALTSITNPTLTTSRVTISGTPAWNWINDSISPQVYSGVLWQIERHGKFVSYKRVGGNAVPNFLDAEGSIVHISTISASPTPAATINVRNTGFYRIVRADPNTDANRLEFWIENDNSIDEVVYAHMAFLSYDSTLPGDKLVINSGIWGANNVGTWTVSNIDLETITGVSSNQQTFYISKAMAPNGAVAALGGNAGLVTIKEGGPSRLFKRIFSIEPNQNDSTLSFVKFDTVDGYDKVSENAGSYIQAMDKLGFPTDIATGIDGYRYNTGLIGEANRVAYGQENDSQTYPGVVAAGARVNIEGPVVHRVQIGLAIRVRTGAAQTEIQNQVRSAVAAVINATNVGTAIAISDLIDAAGSVNGVLSVAVVSPTFSAGTDLINIQPYEKPLVLSLDDDILVSFIGD